MSKKMVMAVISREQADRALDRLISAGYGATFTESRGGMLRQAQQMVFIATNDDDMRCRIQDMMMLTGDGLSVRAKAALNKALIHGFRHDTLVKARVAKAEYLWKLLKECGVPVVQPSGGHAVYIDARELYQHIPEEKFPEKAFLVQLYLDSGVMGSENMITPSQQERGMHMIRLALPIHGYSFSRLRYVAESVGRLWNGLDKLKGLRKVHELPCRSGAFLAEYERE